jgi:hypothetical protein
MHMGAHVMAMPHAPAKGSSWNTKCGQGRWLIQSIVPGQLLAHQCGGDGQAIHGCRGWADGRSGRRRVDVGGRSEQGDLFRRAIDRRTGGTGGALGRCGSVTPINTPTATVEPAPTAASATPTATTARG